MIKALRPRTGSPSVARSHATRWGMSAPTTLNCFQMNCALALAEWLVCDRAIVDTYPHLLRVNPYSTRAPNWRTITA